MPQFPHLCDTDSDAAALLCTERSWSFILGNSVTAEQGAKVIKELD